jgi:hypothetical protein
MNMHSPNASDKSFEYFSSNLGFSVSVVIHPPTNERLKNGLNFLDPDQILPLVPFLEQAALRFAKGNPSKAPELLRSASNWESEQSQSREENDQGMRVLDAAYEERMKAYKNWQLKTLLPLVSKAEIVDGIHEAIGTALANFERIKCEELAEKVGHTLKTSLLTPEGKFRTKIVRGRRLSIFRAKLGRTKGRKNTNPKVTYDRIVKEIRRFKGNEFGIPGQKQIALKLKCSVQTKNALGMVILVEQNCAA